MEVFWEGAPQSQTGSVTGKVEEVANVLESQNAEINQVHRRLDRLGLACQAMWELLRDSTSIEEKDILARMEEVDLRDGVKDEKMTPPSLHCESCGRKGNPRRRMCVYCGGSLPDEGRSAFS
ncbi:MAG: hypothetical protein ACKVJX_21255 [Verrucomicrobiia bacterium]